jgi:hypothetical protein
VLEGLTGVDAGDLVDLGNLGLRAIPKLEARKKKNGTSVATGKSVSIIPLLFLYPKQFGNSLTMNLGYYNGNWKNREKGCKEGRQKGCKGRRGGS